MPASHLVDEVIEALQSHPDPYWARQAAARVLDEAADDSECSECAGFGYIPQRDEIVLTRAEQASLDAAKAYAEKRGGRHLRAVLAILTRLLEEG